MAIGALKALRSLKVDVPKEVAIIGFDGIILTEMVEPEISTIEQPIYDIGTSAVNHLTSFRKKSPTSKRSESGR